MKKLNNNKLTFFLKLLLGDDFIVWYSMKPTILFIFCRVVGTFFCHCIFGILHNRLPKVFCVISLLDESKIFNPLTELVDRTYLYFVW